MKIEVWKRIEGYGDKYEVSNLGSVRSLTKNLNNQIDRYGYVYVTLTHNGLSKKHKVHRLVGEYFIPNPNNLPCINHKNLIRSDNREENLEWCTIEENNRYSKGVKVVLFYKGEFHCFDSASQASKHLNISLDEVYKISKRTTYLTGCVEFILTEGKSVPRAFLGDFSRGGISIKNERFVVRVQASGKRHYVGAFSSKEEAEEARIKFINEHYPISEFPATGPHLSSVYRLLYEEIIKDEKF